MSKIIEKVQKIFNLTQLYKDGVQAWKDAFRMLKTQDPQLEARILADELHRQ